MHARARARTHARTYAVEASQIPSCHGSAQPAVPVCDSAGRQQSAFFVIEASFCHGEVTQVLNAEKLFAAVTIKSY